MWTRTGARIRTRTRIGIWTRNGNVMWTGTGIGTRTRIGIWTRTGIRIWNRTGNVMWTGTGNGIGTRTGIGIWNGNRIVIRTGTWTWIGNRTGTRIDSRNGDWIGINRFWCQRACQQSSTIRDALIWVYISVNLSLRLRFFLPFSSETKNQVMVKSRNGL